MTTTSLISWFTAVVVLGALGGCGPQDEPFAPRDAMTLDGTTTTIHLKPDSTVSRADRRPDDATITARVSAALVSEPDLSGQTINVSTHDGVVTLAGPVDSVPTAQQAGVIAAEIEGVAEVDNQLVATRE